MRVAAVLVAYALAGAFGAPWVLRRSTWPQRAPRLAIALWLASAASVVLALGLAGVALAVPTVPVSAGLSQWLQACAMALRAAYATPGGIILGATGTAFALFVTVRTVVALSGSWARATWARRAHRRAVVLAGRPRHDLDALIVDCDTAAAYCVPGRNRQVVLTTAALAALSDSQLAAVLAHERAHLKGHHHHLVGVASGLARAFPGIPLFQAAKEEVAALVEMVADDVAAGTHHRTTIATAVVALAGMHAPQAALGASGSATLARVRRLTAPAAPLDRGALLVGVLAVMGIAVLPISVAAAPALHAMHMTLCPVHPGITPSTRPA
ncbi:MAG: M56 family metallopeptidase [Actinomycetota bacterium]|nr:M56 family metallopeptidase [Actinomycetota bacterium]